MTTTLIDEIREKCSPELLATRDSTAIAAKVNENRKRIEQPKYIGDGTVSNTMGRPDGPLFVYWLEQAAAQALPENPTQLQIAAHAEIVQAWRLLAEAKLDIGLPIVRDGIDGLVGVSPLTQEQATAIKALALVDDPVDEMTVRRACWSDAGEWMV